MTEVELNQSWFKLVDLLGVTGCEMLSQPNLKRGLFVASCNWDGQRILLKAVSSIGWPDKAETFKKEIQVNSFFDQSHADLPHPKVLKSGENEGLIWIIRTYVEGESLSEDNKKHHILLGYDLIKPKFFAQSEKILDQTIKIISALQAISPNDRAYRTNRYERDLSVYNLAAIEGGIDKKLRQSVDFIDLNSQLYFSEKSLCASHGDLSPSNLIVTPVGDIVVTDFEFFSKDNRVMDIAFLWLFCWRLPEWQQLITKRLIGTETDKVFFRFSIIRTILGWYDGVYDHNRAPSLTLSEKRQKYKDHIWTRYLEAAGQSYEKIISTK